MIFEIEIRYALMYEIDEKIMIPWSDVFVIV